MHRGVALTIGLSPGIPHEGFVAEALGNLAAFELGRDRHERLLWHVVRVEESGGRHHFRLVVRHPDRTLDLGFSRELEAKLRALSDESVDALRVRFESARRAGLEPVPLRHVHASVDFWQDDFWNWIG